MQVVDNWERDEVLREQAQKTAQAIEQYRQEKFAICDQVETVEDLAFQLLGKNRYEENIDGYQDMTVTLLKLLLQPKVTEVMSRQMNAEECSALAKFVHQLYEFFKGLNCEQYRSIFEYKYVKRHYAGDNLKRLVAIEQSYRERLQHYLNDKSAS